MNVLFFFFQAEDGIRDIGVTGVQTCALPISVCTQWIQILIKCLFHSKRGTSLTFMTRDDWKQAGKLIEIMREAGQVNNKISIDEVFLALFLRYHKCLSF